MPDLVKEGASLVPQYLNRGGTAYEAHTGANGGVDVNVISGAGDVAHDAADSGNPMKIGAKANAEEPAAVSENDRANIGTDLKGNLRMVGNVAHSTVDTGNPLKVGYKAVDITSMPADVTAGDRTNAVGDLKGRSIVTMDEVFGTAGSAVPAKGVLVQGSDGTNARALKTSATGGLMLGANSGVDVGDVDVTSTPADATPGSAVPTKGFAVAGSDGTNARLLKTDSSGNQFVTGEIAHDAADSGNPLKVGGKAASSIPTAVTAGDRVNAYFDLNGRQVVLIAKDFLSSTLRASSAQEAGTENGSDVEVGIYSTGTFYLVQSAATGDTHTLNVKIQEKDPVSGSYFDIATFTEISTATGSERKVLSLTGKTIRVVGVVAGTNTPTATWTLGAFFKG